MTLLGDIAILVYGVTVYIHSKTDQFTIHWKDYKGDEPNRMNGNKHIGFTCSTFDLLHAGHIACPEKQKSIMII